MRHLFNPAFSVLMLVFLTTTHTNADWFHDFDGPQLPESWNVFVPPVLEQSSTFTAETSAGYLTIRDTVLPHLAGGAVVLLGEDTSEKFSDVRVSGTVNVGPRLHNRLGLQLRGQRGAYSFGVDLGGSPNSGTAWFVLPNGSPGPPIELNSVREFGIPTRLDIETSYYLELDVIGDQLTGRVFDEKGGNELLSMSHTAPTLLGLGNAGVFAQHILDDIPVGGTFDDVSAIAIRPGDFDIDGTFSAADIDALTRAISTGAEDGMYDLNQDNNVDLADHHYWVKELKQTWLGDSNLDGEFNSSDMVEAFKVGKYEVDAEAGWAEGDWNADLRFDSGDFVAAFQDGGYEQGPRVALNAVPEPSCSALLAIGVIGMFHMRKRR